MKDYQELFNRYVDKGWLCTADNQTASILVSGKAAQLYSGTWMFPQIAQADPSFEFGCYPIPDRAPGCLLKHRGPIPLHVVVRPTKNQVNRKLSKMEWGCV